MNRPRVLLSDDDTILLRALVRAATSTGLDPIVAPSGDVLALARAHRPALILIDIHQEGFDGRDVLAQLKSDPLTAPIEVVVMSGTDDQAVRNECLALGALSFMPKPFEQGWIDQLANCARAAASAMQPH